MDMSFKHESTCYCPVILHGPTYAGDYSILTCEFREPCRIVYSPVGLKWFFWMSISYALNKWISLIIHIKLIVGFLVSKFCKIGVCKKTKKTEKKINRKNRTSKKNRLNRLKYLGKCLVRSGFRFWCAWTGQPEPNRTGSV